MFLKAGALSLALLLASRFLGLARESAQAAAFGISGVGDVAVLMLTLPDWIAGVLASGALAYVLLPAWASHDAAAVAAMQRRVARDLVAVGAVLALLLALSSAWAIEWLVPGLGADLRPAAARGLWWSAAAVPLALLAALWSTRLQHESEFVGMYSANLVVNALIIATLAIVAIAFDEDQLLAVGVGLLVAMVLRLVWLRWRLPASVAAPASAESLALPGPSAWAWAGLAAGLPLALPFVARSLASQGGEGGLALFNYAWKLVELPLMLAVQLVATLAFPRIARAVAGADAPGASQAIRAGFALAFTLACAAAAGLALAAPAVAQLLFGWGRMQPEGVAVVAQWGGIGAWGLLPQACIAVGLTVLAAEGRMRAPVMAYAIALVALLVAGRAGVSDGAALMALLNMLLLGVAVVVVLALGARGRACLPWRSFALAGLPLLPVAAVARQPWLASQGMVWSLVAGTLAAAGVVAIASWGSPDVRAALRR